jgi:conjugal transfer ATP-binding protein TraC
MRLKRKENPDVLARSQKKIRKGIKTRVGEFIQHHMDSAVDWVRPQESGETPLNVAAAQKLAERVTLSSLLSYANISDAGLILNDDGNEIRVGFMIEYAPFTAAGTDSESQMDSIIGLADRPNTVFQFGCLSSTEVMSYLNHWEHARTHKATSEILAKMAKERADFYRGATYTKRSESGDDLGYSLIQGRRVHPKKHNFYVTVMVPFSGNIEDDTQWEQFEEEVRKLRSSMSGTLGSAGVHCHSMRREEVRHVLRKILNPHHIPEKLLMDDMEYLEDFDPTVPYASIHNLVEKDTRMTVHKDGTLGFEASSDEDDIRRKRIVSLTVDRFPAQTYLPLTARLMGDATQTTQAIDRPFWIYTNIVTLDNDDARDRMTVKMARVSKQLISDSEAYQAFVSHLFEMRDQLKDITAEARKGTGIVGAYMGINILTDADSAQEDAQAVSSLWRRHGFDAKPEKFITLPIFLCSVPGHFRPEMDPLKNRSGLQRIMTMTSFQAATLTHMEGEWRGSSEKLGGIPLISRRGELASVSIQDKGVTNFNFCVIADSGAGKSFFAQDIVLDFLSKNGLAFIIDAGRSYFEFVEQMGGTNLVFKVNEPLDLNPFAQIKTENDLKEMIEMLKDVIAYMAWPNSERNEVPDWEYVTLERAIEETWQNNRENNTVGHVSEWLLNHEDRAAQKIGEQLRPYSVGRLADWFNGKGKKVDLKGNLICFEMDELKAQGAFRDVALTMMMQRVADAMYHGGDSSIPKLLLIDEAWDLLSSNQAGPFINRAWRTVRKFGGSCGFITQKFSDCEMSEAAKAAYANSAWLFMLQQKSESIRFAFDNGYFPDDPQTKKLVESVHTRPGYYSEVMVKSTMGIGVYRFVIDPYTYWLYSTDKDDKAARAQMLEKVVAENPDMARSSAMAEALSRLAAGRYKDMFGKTPESELKKIQRAIAA